MTEFNPYAPPVHSDLVGAVKHQDNAAAWQENGIVVMPRVGGWLPRRCVQCNAPATSNLIKTLYWHPQALYLLIFFPGLLIYAIVAAIVRKSAVVDFGLCEEHRRRRRLGMIIGWGGGSLSMLLLFVGTGMDEGAVAVVGGVALLATMIAGSVLVRIATTTKIDATEVRFKVGKPFVDALPYAPRG